VADLAAADRSGRSERERLSLWRRGQRIDQKLVVVIAGDAVADIAAEIETAPVVWHWRRDDRRLHDPHVGGSSGRSQSEAQTRRCQNCEGMMHGIPPSSLAEGRFYRRPAPRISGCGANVVPFEFIVLVAMASRLGHRPVAVDIASGCCDRATLRWLLATSAGAER